MPIFNFLSGGIRQGFDNFRKERIPLRPNCLLTRDPILIVVPSSEKKISKSLQLFLCAHGYQVERLEREHDKSVFSDEDEISSKINSLVQRFGTRWHVFISKNGDDSRVLTFLRNTDLSEASTTKIDFDLLSEKNLPTPDISNRNTISEKFKFLNYPNFQKILDLCIELAESDFKNGLSENSIN